jgi:Protein of unknown function (DUF3500)
VASQSAKLMADAAVRLIESLDRAQRDAACKPFPDDEERRQWFYTPTDHGGLPLAQMSSAQHRKVHQLVATGLSRAGYVTVAAIMGLENVLDHLEGWSANFGRERGRDPLLYYVTIFGDPSGTAPWGWRFGGHHVSLHFTVASGEVQSATPNFLGADPAGSPLLGPHLHRPLAAIEDLGRELFRSLDEEKRAKALVASVAPFDLVGSNRASLASGDGPRPMEQIWRGVPTGAFEQRLLKLQEQIEANLKATTADLEAVSFTKNPKGIPATELNAAEKELLRALIDCYVNRLPDDLADAQAALVSRDFDKLGFLWAGSGERNEPHYYRIQGERIFIEYDNAQRGGNHIHAVWRDLTNDFDGDVLARHYAESH